MPNRERRPRRSPKHQGSIPSNDGHNKTNRPEQAAPQAEPQNRLQQQQ